MLQNQKSDWEKTSIYGYLKTELEDFITVYEIGAIWHRNMELLRLEKSCRIMGFNINPALSYIA